MQKLSDNSEKIDRLVEQMAKMQDLLSDVICARADEKMSSTEMEDENNNKRLSSSTNSRRTGTNIDSSDSSSPIRRQQAPVTRRTTYVKIPPFTGKEDWRVWLHRFEDIAERRGWNEATKLDELLPRLHETAGDFVFGQLDKARRGNYKTVVSELGNRFRIVETRRTFGAKFSSRNQQPGETVEDYAAELKRLYDKAHPKRNWETREEDLLRRFLDGLSDDKAQFHVEYVKEPANIDEAVFEVVNFNETGNKTRDGKRHVRQVGGDDKSSEDDNKSNSPRKRRWGRRKPQQGYAKQAKTGGDDYLHQQFLVLRRELDELRSNGGTAPKPLLNQPAGNLPSLPMRLDVPPPSLPVRPPPNVGNKLCYRCGSPGHFVRECPVPASYRPVQRGNMPGTQPLNRM